MTHSAASTSRILDQCRRELVLDLVRSSGPGGQNVNKVATAVQLRFDIPRARALDDQTKARLIRQGGRRVTARGVLVLRAARYRAQASNRKEVLSRFQTLLERCLVAPKPRRPTRASDASRERRLESKKHRAQLKRRRAVPDFD